MIRGTLGWDIKRLCAKEEQGMERTCRILQLYCIRQHTFKWQWHGDGLGEPARQVEGQRGEGWTPAVLLQRQAFAIKLPPAAMATLCCTAFWSKRWQAGTRCASCLLPNLASLLSNQDRSTEVGKRAEKPLCRLLL